ncbi:MAG TPA: histone deacetylase [Verrucomicrobia bacterium]|nr:histone deacetylase [Verrucomicrobiota bacterium]HOB32116.1 histone deacetylase [Verrucomicrobiota bacterium]HOP96808.1 histone deacetylase [Verrucomicrobiota bacterium]
MKVITDESCTSYSSPGHPERPARVARTVEKLQSQTDLKIVWAQPGPVDEAAILRAHTAEHLARLDVAEDFDDDTPFHPGISKLARQSVGAALEALRCARNGETVFSLIRPPGHHATRSSAMGFCYLNSIAIAALEALATGTERIAVYDFDVHHGNGTEAILKDVPGAMFLSIHQYPGYPGTGARNVGDNCLNFPVPPNTNREDYRAALSSALESVKQFKPDLLAVSAGFDAYHRDPLAEGTLEAEDFFWLGQRIRELGVPTFSILEGGYSRDLPDLILAYLKGIEG